MSAANLKVITPEATAPAVTAEQLDLVRRTVASGATDQELKLFLYDCARQGVHPLDRLLHFTKRGGKYTPVTSIDLMRTRAADTGEYAGSDDAIFDSEPTPTRATVTVYRLVGGVRCPFSATARWSEYVPPAGQDHMWRKMPATMLAKCAEALALRKGFPRQLAGLYAREEMDQAGAEPNGNGREVVNTVTGEVLPELPKPEGFDEWFVDFEACADNGFSAVTKAWTEAPGGIRTYVNKVHKAAKDAIVAKARETDKRGGAGK